MRIILVCALDSLLEPDYGFSRVTRLTKQTFEQDDAELVHGRHIAKLSCTLLPLHRFDRIPPGPPTLVQTDLAADSCTISRLRMAELGGRLIKLKGLPRILHQTKLTAAVAVS